jgi:hypothetical protein
MKCLDGQMRQNSHIRNLHISQHCEAARPHTSQCFPVGSGSATSFFLWLGHCIHDIQFNKITGFIISCRRCAVYELEYHLRLHRVCWSTLPWQEHLRRVKEAGNRLCCYCCSSLNPIVDAAPVWGRLLASIRASAGSASGLHEDEL